ncbi:MAG: hypothetical protein IJL12_01915 [Selenomonadaceae bacterium]|nr:hypothetical protein [Selenomonadaceae bacterium]
MEFYTKPAIVGYNATRGIVPFAIAGAPIAITTGLSLAQAAAAAGVAALAGAAVGAAVARKGNTIIDSTHTSALTARKEFVFA